MGATLSSTVYITRAMCFFSFFIFSFHSFIGWEEFGMVQDSDIFVYPEIKYGFISPKFSWNNRRTGKETANIRTEMKCTTFPAPTSEQVSLLLFVKHLPKYSSCFWCWCCCSRSWNLPVTCQKRTSIKLFSVFPLMTLCQGIAYCRFETIIVDIPPAKVFRICFISSLYLISRLRSLSNFFHSISKNFLMCTYTQLKWSIHCSSSSST